MKHLLPKDDSFGEVLFFGQTESEIKENQDFKDFLEDYKVQATYSVELIKGIELLPSFLDK